MTRILTVVARVDRTWVRPVRIPPRSGSRDDSAGRGRRRRRATRVTARTTTLASRATDTSARTDEALREALVPVEAQFGRDVHRLAVRLLGADESRPGVRQSIQATLDLLRGLGVANLLTDDAPRREALLASWKDTLFVQLYGAQANEGNP